MDTLASSILELIASIAMVVEIRQANCSDDNALLHACDESFIVGCEDRTEGEFTCTNSREGACLDGHCLWDHPHV